ncbi:hypothetical protein [Kitasatospora sp. NPDC057223]|uniref:hypothetical protein n=1 Tax=Kitasatospora sp. NPDC057223 TaxID=3346055 RepID=UPI00364588AB
MSRRSGGDLEAFIAFLGGMLAAGLLALALLGARQFVELTPGLLRLAKGLGAALWLTVTVLVYRRLRAQGAGPAPH